ncbi:uncharacterized protein LOC133825847 [Humulus lupulus]|uniref:uncharacterized protein LOC133825847 n=1 Tax=Humulus lupulus TaxID=3486 RepID=UPI002B407121|nr:uncharacterized protein LOC133825847 [Humulus lupulus]
MKLLLLISWNFLGSRLICRNVKVLGINVSEEVVESRAREIGCEMGQWPIQYLGLPLGASPRSKRFWEPVVSKCAKCLDGWKSDFLSRGGRLALIQFRIPKNVAGIIEKLMRDFLWEGADWSGPDHLVSWLEVCNSRGHGGLGIGNLVKRNKAFLMKWLWRFPLEDYLKVFFVIGSNYALAGTCSNLFSVFK